MMDNSCISIVGLPALSTLGIRSVLKEAWNGKIECFSSFAEFMPLAEEMNAFIVSADLFACNLDFFLPRKMKTLLVVKGGDLFPHSSGIAMVADNDDEAEIKAAIMGFVAGLEEPAVSRGDLSARETEVLKLIASGKINKEIADDLCISVNTVITHRKNLSAKLGIKSASGLSLYAMMNGIL